MINMPDITMCLNSKCTMRYNCYRFTAKVGNRFSKCQSFAIFGFDEKLGTCLGYIDNKGKDNDESKSNRKE